MDGPLYKYYGKKICGMEIEFMIHQTHFAKFEGWPSKDEDWPSKANFTLVKFSTFLHLCFFLHLWFFFNKIFLRLWVFFICVFFLHLWFFLVIFSSFLFFSSTLVLSSFVVVTAVNIKIILSSTVLCAVTKRLFFIHIRLSRSPCLIFILFSIQTVPSTTEESLLVVIF